MPADSRRCASVLAHVRVEAGLARSLQGAWVTCLDNIEKEYL